MINYAAALITLALAGPVVAQTELVRFPAVCTTMVTLSEVLSEYDEMPAMTMISNREANNTILGFKTVMFINYETRTWTLVEKITKDSYCIVATGEDISPYDLK